MEKKQAFEIINKVYASFNGNLSQHSTIQTALNIISKELFAEKVKKKKD